MRIDLDTSVHCVDREFGELADVVIDPRSRQLTHLVIQPPDLDGHARLVDIADARDESGPGGVSLACTSTEISRLDPIQESAFVQPGELPTGDTDWDVGIQEMYALPESGSLGPEILGSGMTLDYDQHVVVSYHRVPKGAVEIRRESPVSSSDGHHLGHVVGFAVDNRNAIVHLVLEHGHLWGKRQVAIPGSAIERLRNDELTLCLTSEAVGAMKPLVVHRAR